MGVGVGVGGYLGVGVSVGVGVGVSRGVKIINYTILLGTFEINYRS